ncbi:MAG: ABC transporter substrate-binding protein [archaeon]
MKKNYYYYLVCLVAMALFIAGCAKTEQAKTQEQISDRSLLNVKERGKLIIGIDPDFPPMRLIDNSGNLVGYDVDVANEIAAQLKIPVDIKRIAWGELFDNVKSGNVDIVISAITITPKRTEEMLFSIPYFDAGQVIIVGKDNTGINTPEDLKGKKVGVLKGTTCEEAALQYTDSSLIAGYSSNQDIISDIKKNSLDAMVTDLIGASGYVKSDSSIKIVGEPFTQEYYGIATKLGNDALMDEINRVVRDMKRSGKLKEIKDKWLK